METSDARKILKELRSNPPSGIAEYEDNHLVHPLNCFIELIRDNSEIFWKVLESKESALCSCEKTKPVLGIDLIRAAKEKGFNLPFDLKKQDVNYLQWVIRYNGSSFWRMVELAEIALYSFENNKIISGMNLTRSSMETTSILIYLYRKFIVNKEIEELDIYELFNILLCNHNDREELNRNISVRCNINEKQIKKINFFGTKNIMSYIDKVCPNFRSRYDDTCEFVHPNYYGCSGFYSKNEGSNLPLNFGPEIIGDETLKKYIAQGHNLLAAVLNDFKKVYDGINKIF